MRKMICYEKNKIDQLIFLINGLKMPVLENADYLKEIRGILESGIGGEMKEEVENVLDTEKIRKD